jgi:hypothetical protein
MVPNSFSRLMEMLVSRAQIHHQEHGDQSGTKNGAFQIGIEHNPGFHAIPKDSEYFLQYDRSYIH